jgi:hypothetical protein
MRHVQVVILRVRGFEPPLLLCSRFRFFLRYGVVGNMSGSHPVASGSIPGIEFFLLWNFGFLSSVGRALC